MIEGKIGTAKGMPSGIVKDWLSLWGCLEYQPIRDGLKRDQSVTNDSSNNASLLYSAQIWVSCWWWGTVGSAKLLQRSEGGSQLAHSCLLKWTGNVDPPGSYFWQ